MQIVLKDRQKNTEFNLKSGQAYAFNSDVVNDANRFSVIFSISSKTTGLNDNEKPNVQVFVNAGNQITIVAPEKSNYAIYNAVGQLIENGQTTAKLQTVNCKLQTGVYIVKVVNQSTRVIIK